MRRNQNANVNWITYINTNTNYNPENPYVSFAISSSSQISADNMKITLQIASLCVLVRFYWLRNRTKKKLEKFQFGHSLDWELDFTRIVHLHVHRILIYIEFEVYETKLGSSINLHSNYKLHENNYNLDVICAQKSLDRQVFTAKISVASIFSNKNLFINYSRGRVKYGFGFSWGCCQFEYEVYAFGALCIGLVHSKSTYTKTYVRMHIWTSISVLVI